MIRRATFLYDGGFRGGLRGGGFHGGLRGGGFLGGGFSGGAGGAGRDFSQDLYADYSRPDQQVGAGAGAGVGLRMNGFGAGGGGGGGGFGGQGFGNGVRAGGFPDAELSQQIMVQNLLWSTANEDLVELFETTGDTVKRHGCRSILQSKFQNYMYGGRPLDVRFNDCSHTFTPTAAKGGQVVPIVPDAA